MRTDNKGTHGPPDIICGGRTELTLDMRKRGKTGKSCRTTGIITRLFMAFIGIAVVTGLTLLGARGDYPTSGTTEVADTATTETGTTAMFLGAVEDTDSDVALAFIHATPPTDCFIMAHPDGNCVLMNTDGGVGGTGPVAGWDSKDPPEPKGANETREPKDPCPGKGKDPDKGKGEKPGKLAGDDPCSPDPDPWGPNRPNCANELAGNDDPPEPECKTPRGPWTPPEPKGKGPECPNCGNKLAMIWLGTDPDPGPALALTLLGATEPDEWAGCLSKCV